MVGEAHCLSVFIFIFHCCVSIMVFSNASRLIRDDVLKEKTRNYQCYSKE